jgi:DNA-binding response OmpR family regulator
MQDSTKRPKILIVDDDRDILEMLSDIFNAEGFKVVTAIDGVDATFKFNNDTFDVIMTDIKMPKKDGIKFIQHVNMVEGKRMTKVGSKHKPIPIVLISAAVDEYTMELELINHVDIMAKPFTAKQAVQKVQGLLFKKPVSTSGATLEFKAGDTIMKEGDTDDNIYFVKNGLLRVTKKDRDGQDVLVCTVGPGEIVGELGFLLKKTRSASVVASQDSSLILIPKQKFEEIISEQPKWFKVLFETISTRLEETTSQLVEERSKRISSNK